MNSMETRASILEAVKEAGDVGLRQKTICRIIGLSSRTLQRWGKELCEDRRKNSPRAVPHRLTEVERKEILRVVNLPEYRGLAPAEIVAILAEKGLYIGSERTIYRILKANNQLGHRGPGRRPSRRERPSHRATGPGQILSWDITYLRTNINGMFFYLYMVMDVWSRKIVAWEIHSEENSELSAAMMERLSRSMNLNGTIVHADNGGPMKGATMLAKLYELGVVSSFSRPRVSEDNPFSEALFKTLKYRPGYPRKFDSLEKARNWVADFVHWYNHEHRHSGIKYVTPEERHTGQDRQILRKRSETYRIARERNPDRWSGNTRDWSYQEEVILGASKAA